MTTSTIIGRASFVRGRVSGAGDIEIAGRVEGDVACSGEVIIDTHGLVAANVSAARIVVRGAVKGDLVADESVHIESGARVVGDLKAPRVAIAAGGLVRGHVQTGGAAPARPRAAAAAAATAAPARTSETKARPAPPPPARATTAAPAPSKSNANHKAPRGAILSGSRVGPPAPVVPVLKKGTKAVQKKRA